MQTEKNEYLYLFCLGMKHVEDYRSIYLYYLITHFLFKLTKMGNLFDWISFLDLWICRIIKLPFNKKFHKQIIVILNTLLPRIEERAIYFLQYIIEYPAMFDLASSFAS